MRKYLFGGFLAIVFLLCLIGFSQAESYDWTNIYSSNFSFGSLIVASDGAVYASMEAGESPYARVWKYSNNSWTDVTGSLWLNGRINVLAEGSDGSIYAGGQVGFEMILGRVWKYSGGNWSDVTGSLYSGPINSLLVASDGALYAGGYAKVWKYTGSDWQDISGSSFYETGVKISEIFSLIQADDGVIYAGGENNESHQTGRIWKYFNNSWVDVTGPLDAYGVYSLIQDYDGFIYAGGEANSTGKIWKYTDGNWADITGTFRAGRINSLLLVSDGSIMAGGCVTVSCTEAVMGKYYEGSWTNIIGNLSGSAINSLAQADVGAIYAGGVEGLGSKVWKHVLTNQEFILTQQQNLRNGEKIILSLYLTSKSKISGQDLKITFTDLPTKLTKKSNYWLKFEKFNNYSKSSKKRAIKKYWKLTTNLNKYKADKIHEFKIKVSFSFTKAEFKKLKKKNILAKKKNLYLLARTKSGSWKMMNGFWNDVKIIRDLKKHKFTVSYFTKFPKKVYYFGIMLK